MGLLGLTSSNSTKPSESQAHSWLNATQNLPPDLPANISSLTSINILSQETVVGFLLGSLATVSLTAAHARFYKRIPNTDSVPLKLLQKRKWIKGVVTSVGDADNFRLYHTPGLFWRWPIKLRRVPVDAKDLKDATLHIRMAGVDAPEASHFGKPAQPYAAEAMAWLKQEIEGRRLWVQLLRKDQYGRIVSMPVHPRRIPFLSSLASRSVPLRMLQAGFAETYEQAGAEYGRWGKEHFLSIQAEAKHARRGMWASETELESVAEYKKRTKAGDESPAMVSQSKNAPQKKGFFDFLKFWSR